MSVFWSNVLGYGLLSLLLVGFLSMVAGYTVLVRQALRSPDRRAAIKRVFTGWTPHDRLDKRGVVLILVGALLGAVVFTTFLVLVFFVPGVGRP